MTEATFVYQEVEVKLTGRKAQKKAAPTVKNVPVLVEVTPVHEADGTWKRWVPLQALFEIVEGE